MENATLQQLLSRLTPAAAAALTPSEALRCLDDLRPFVRHLRQGLGAWGAVEFMRECLEMQTPRHVQEWCALLQSHKNLVVEAARDHGKSWPFSYAWPLFNVQRCRDPKNPVHIALVSYSEEQARKNLARIRKAIENNPLLR